MVSNRTNGKADTVSSGDLTPAAALALLRSEIGVKREEPVDPGYMTTDECAEWLGVSKGTALPLLKNGVKTGSVLLKYFCRYNGYRFQKFKYYKFVVKGKK